MRKTKKNYGVNEHQYKINLMRRLIDVYQQVDNVRPESSKLIVEDHMHKLEAELVGAIIVGGKENGKD